MILLHRYEHSIAKYCSNYGLSQNISQQVDRDIQGFDDMNGKRFYVGKTLRLLIICLQNELIYDAY